MFRARRWFQWISKIQNLNVDMRKYTKKSVSASNIFLRFAEFVRRKLWININIIIYM